MNTQLIIIAISLYYTYISYDSVDIFEFVYSGVFVVLITMAITLTSNLAKIMTVRNENEAFFVAKECKRRISQLKGFLFILPWAWVLPSVYKPITPISIFVTAYIISYSLSMFGKRITEWMEFYDCFVKNREEEQKERNRI